MEIRNIVFVGAGNLATNVALALYDRGYRIVQVYSRTMSSAQMLADRLEAEAVTDIRAIVADADLYVISVKDSALQSVIGQLCNGTRSGLFVHTAGSIPMDIFKDRAEHYGVLYPMQSFSKQRRVDFTEVPIFIESNGAESLKAIETVAKSLCDKVYTLSSEARKHLHLAAVFACNFVNHCYELSAEVLSKYKIPFDVMLPLVDETARKVHEIAPVDAQTGPAVRYDENVISMQSGLLQTDSRLQEIYDMMSRSIHEVYLAEKKKDK